MLIFYWKMLKAKGAATAAGVQNALFLFFCICHIILENFIKYLNLGEKSFWCLWLCCWAILLLLLVVVVGWEKVCRIFSGCSLLHSTSSPVAWILWDFIIGNYWQIFPQNVLWFPKLYPHFRLEPWSGGCSRHIGTTYVFGSLIKNVLDSIMFRRASPY